ncbi:MAG TPA: ATP-binding protein [Solirubrobacterales bacterium]|nr:ATP-binding protein [Solirubrobacterales bacterium]
MWIDDATAYIAALAPARLVFLPALGGAGATLAAAVRDGRRRTVLNERLHELRRPLQALALMAPRPGASGARAWDDGPVEMAAAALAALEREINGERADGPTAVVALRPLLEAARRRWRGQAAMFGARLALRWRAEEAAVEGNRLELAAALDNLIANALEHGGGSIELAADLAGDRVCLAVVDSGSGAGRRAREREAARKGRDARRWRDSRPFGRLTGRARHGHGLRLVRRTAVRHGGTFALHRGEGGTSAVLELPLAPPARTDDGRSAEGPGSGGGGTGLDGGSGGRR